MTAAGDPAPDDHSCPDDHSWSPPAAFAGQLPDGVGVLGPDGTVVWANQALAGLLGMTLDELVGANGFELVHPDELARAFDGVAYAAQFPDRTAVVPYRLQGGDGSWHDVELKSAVVGDAGGDHIVLVVRDGTTRRMVTRVLRSVASGRPLEETARLVCEAVTARWPESAAAVAVSAPDGGRSVTSVGLPEELVRHAAALTALPGDRDEEGIVIVELADLPDRVRTAAKEVGFEACAVAAVADPGGAEGYLVAWFDHAVIARLEFSHDADELVELLVLAVERRHDLHQLWFSARHDALTGLRNRAGFFEVVPTVLEGTRADPGVVAGLAYVDLDGFKAVNDLLGHAEGDRLLADVASRLRAAVRADDVLARIGGDEFVVLSRLAADGAEQGAELLRDRIGLAIPEASIGVAVDDGETTADGLLERADAAMYDAKRRRQR